MLFVCSKWFSLRLSMMLFLAFACLTRTYVTANMLSIKRLATLKPLPTNLVIPAPFSIGREGLNCSSPYA
jgi:hypothetical protein